MISINIDNFESVSNSFGSEFAEKVLKQVADKLVEVAGHQRVIGHVFANRFVILAQDDSDEQLQAICDEIERSIGRISEVDGMQCTIFALAGFTRMSQHGDLDAMKRYNREKRLERRSKWQGSSEEHDIITTTLF